MSHGSPVDFVDAHQHFQDIKRHYYPWLCDKDAPEKLEGDLTPIRRNYLPADYLSDMTPVRLIKSVHVQNGWNPVDPVGETRWLQGLADRGGFPHAIVAFADLAAPDVAGTIEAHLAFPNMRGIRQILNWHEDPRFRVASQSGLMNDSAWRRGFGLLSRYGLSFDLQIYWPQMAVALQLAKDYPDTPILLNHFGMPIDRTPEGVAAWAHALALLAQAPNVMVKLSGLGLGHPNWTIEDTAPLLLRAIDIFGVERAMFATNLPVDRLFSEPARILLAFDSALKGFNPAERAALLRVNAEQAYRI
jgi:predicted TIM-barrel fold metal-dependent hydrolase